MSEKYDSYYHDVLDVYGESSLREAGWLDEEGVYKAPEHFGFPQAAIENLRENSVVLLTTGAFSPIHEGHILMMDAAARELEAAGYHIAGGFFSPSHDAYVNTKADGAAACHHEVRIAKLEDALEDTLYRTDPWEARYCSGKINFTTVIKHIEKALAYFYGMEIPVVYVFGSDNAYFAKAFVKRGKAICVEREGHPVPDELKSIKQVTFLGAVSSHASSKIRKPREEEMKPPKQKEVIHYHVRDDLREDYISKIKTTEFKTGFITNLERTLPPSQIHVHKLGTEHKILQERIGERKVLSLDVHFEGNANIEVSRIFEICSQQKRSLGLAARPGSKPLEEQMQGLKGAFVLVDDDSSTGETRRFVADLLKEVQIEEFISILSLNTDKPVYDIIDLRDFVLGHANSGLSVKVKGKPLRAIYAFPYVSPVTRASIPEEAALSFSAEVWRLNSELYRGSGIKLGDLDQNSVAFLYSYGFTAHHEAHEVASQHYRILTEVNKHKKPPSFVKMLK